jgi:hypothetical protein
MSNQKTTRIFTTSLKVVIQNAFKLLAIGIAWTMRLIGLLVTQIADVIERIIIKKSNL